MDRRRNNCENSQRRERRSDRRGIRRKEIKAREKVEKSRSIVFFQFQCFLAAEGGKVCSLKRRVGSHPVVTRSTFRSQNVQSTSGSDHFWKLRCGKCTPMRREAHFQVKIKKHGSVGALLEDEVFKKRTRLWREAH